MLAFNLLDTGSKFRMNVMLVKLTLNPFFPQCISVFTSLPRAKFYMRSSSVPLVTTTKLKDETKLCDRCRVVIRHSMELSPEQEFHVLPTSLKNPKVSVVPTSQVCASFTGCRTLKTAVLGWPPTTHCSYKFHENLSTSSKVEGSIRSWTALRLRFQARIIIELRIYISGFRSALFTAGDSRQVCRLFVRSFRINSKSVHSWHDSEQTSWRIVRTTSDAIHHPSLNMVLTIHGCKCLNTRGKT
jgi:hypothetical protein